MNKQPPKKAKILTRLRIDEVSMVDRGAGERCRVIISKRADDQADDNRPVEMPDNERRYWAALGATALRHAEERYAKDNGAGAADHEPADDEPENPYKKFFVGMKVSESAARAMAKVAADLNKATCAMCGGDHDSDSHDDAKPAVDAVEKDTDGGNDHHASKVADLLVESGKHPDRQSALDFLLHHKDGAAMLRRLHKSQHEDTPNMTSEQKIRDIAKREGVHVIAKIMVADQRSYGITQDDLVGLISEHDRQPGESAAKCFSRHYEADTADGLALRKAVEITKSAPLQDDSEATADAEAACRELQKIGDNRWPSLSPAQRFARAAETNPSLLAKAHRRPSVFSTSFPWPR